MNARAIPWLTTLRDWPVAALALLERAGTLARVLIVQVRGSAPREAGVTLLVSAQEVIGTIGGGQLEWQAISAARALLAATAPFAQVERWVLGTDLGQCCGGVVEVWIERLTAIDRDWLQRAARAVKADRPMLLESTLADGRLQRRLIELRGAEAAGADAAIWAPQLTRCANGQVALRERLDVVQPALWLFGAGYVGQAVARLFMELPVRLTWIDARTGLFPSERPGPVRIVNADPLASLDAAPPGAYFLIMTHSHALDYALCHALLGRNDFAWLGLIGSQSKSARFRSRLAREGLPRERLARLVCPIGAGGIASKWPMAIAVSIAAQLLEHLPQARARVGAPAASCPGADCAHCGTPSGEVR